MKKKLNYLHALRTIFAQAESDREGGLISIDAVCNAILRQVSFRLSAWKSSLILCRGDHANILMYVLQGRRNYALMTLQLAINDLITQSSKGAEKNNYSFIDLWKPYFDFVTCTDFKNVSKEWPKLSIYHTAFFGY